MKTMEEEKEREITAAAEKKAQNQLNKELKAAETLRKKEERIITATARKLTVEEKKRLNQEAKEARAAAKQL